jgi:hypothetical protein
MSGAQVCCSEEWDVSLRIAKAGVLTKSALGCAWLRGAQDEWAFVVCGQAVLVFETPSEDSTALAPSGASRERWHSVPDGTVLRLDIVQPATRSAVSSVESGDTDWDRLLAPPPEPALRKAGASRVRQRAFAELVLDFHESEGTFPDFEQLPTLFGKDELRRAGEAYSSYLHLLRSLRVFGVDEARFRNLAKELLETFRSRTGVVPSARAIVLLSAESKFPAFTEDEVQGLLGDTGWTTAGPPSSLVQDEGNRVDADPSCGSSGEDEIFSNAEATREAVRLQYGGAAATPALLEALPKAAKREIRAAFGSLLNFLADQGTPHREGAQ